MISKTMEKALNEQVNAELYSAYLYLSMQAYFEAQNFKGFANWMNVQTREEVTHAMRLYDFINKRGGKVALKPIAGPETDWKSPAAVFEQVAAHESKVTGLINDLVKLAIQEKDHAANSFLQWFVNEQVEEEASAAEVLGKVKLAQDAPGAMFMIDKELAARVFTPPAVQTT
jgi:ferritin